MKIDKIKEMLKFIYDRDYSVSILTDVNYDTCEPEFFIEYGELRKEYHIQNETSTHLSEYIDTVGTIKYETLLQLFRDKKIKEILNGKV